MVELTANPYRHDVPGRGPFFGRVTELSELSEAITTGKQAIAAVMGGRGMGKTSLALRLKASLEAHGDIEVHLIRKPNGEPAQFLEQLGVYLGYKLSAIMPVESIAEAVRARERPRVALLVDGIESLIATDRGRALLDNLRIAYEELGGKLGIVVFGGSKLRELLSSDTSAFLRTASWIPLRGLSLGETTALVREPLGLAVPDELIEVLWEQTGGHPLLLQAIMEDAVARGGAVADRLYEAILTANEEQFEKATFPIWWNNLQKRGQESYRALLSHGVPLEQRSFVRVLGAGPDAWIEVLETTGIARVVGEQLLPRCSLFRSWMERNHPLDEPESRINAERHPLVSLERLSTHPFEQIVVSSLARWARTVVEFPSSYLRADRSLGNARLLPELHFQLGALGALRQRDLLVEPEPLSSARGRADLKILWPRETTRRACVEVKIWNHTGYQDVVKQVLGYAVPEDEFACVVMVDRQARSLTEPYREECLRVEIGGTLLWPEEGATVPAVRYPALVTLHNRPQAPPIRLYHFLVQLPPDGAT